MIRLCQDPTWQWGVMARTKFWVCVHFDLGLGDMTLCQGHDTPLGHGQKCVKYYPDLTWRWGVIARTWIISMWALWPWHWRYDPGSITWHTLGSWTISVWNIIQIQHGNEELWPWHGFSVYMHFDLGDMTLDQGHYTPLGHGEQLCEILRVPKKQLRVMARTWIWGVLAVTLTLEIWPWVKVITHPWIMDNNYVKYYQDPTWQWGVMARTQISGMCSLWPWPWRYDLGYEI